MAFGQTLKGASGIGDDQEIGIGIRGDVVRKHLYDEVAYTSAIEFANVFVSVVASGA